MKRIRKDEFTKMVHRKVNGEMKQEVNYWSVYWTIRAVLECMKDIIEEGNSLYLREYFTIFPQLKKEKRTGNFGKPYIIPEHYKPFFRPHNKLNEACEHLQENKDEDNRD